MALATKRQYIKLRIAATKSRTTREHMATIELTKHDARWLFLHASFGASKWLEDNKAEHVANRSFYIERLGAYKQLMLKCEGETTDTIQCILDLHL